MVEPSWWSEAIVKRPPEILPATRLGHRERYLAPNPESVRAKGVSEMLHKALPGSRMELPAEVLGVSALTRQVFVQGHRKLSVFACACVPMDSVRGGAPGVCASRVSKRSTRPPLLIVFPRRTFYSATAVPVGGVEKTTVRQWGIRSIRLTKSRSVGKWTM